MDTTNDTTHPADANTSNLFEPPFLANCTSDSTEPAPMLHLQTPPSATEGNNRLTTPPAADGSNGPATIRNTSTTIPLDNDNDLPFPVPVLGNEHQHQAREFQIMPGMSKTAQINALLDEVARLKAENQQLGERLDKSRTHCAMAAGRIGDYKKRANAKDTQGTKWSTKSDLRARWTTGGPGHLQFDVMVAEKKEKARKKEEKKKKREIAQAQKQAEQYARGPTQVFSGSLSMKNKDDLLEIVTALAIPLPAGKRFTKADLSEKIKSHLDAHASELKANPHFAPLYGGRGQHRELVAASAAQENLPAPPGPSAASSWPLDQDTHMAIQPFAGPSQLPLSHSFGTPITNTATTVPYPPHHSASGHPQPYNYYNPLNFLYNVSYNAPLDHMHPTEPNNPSPLINSSLNVLYNHLLLGIQTSLYHTLFMYIAN